MTFKDFSSQWVSIGDNRILLVSRDGFPSEIEEFIARISVEFLQHNSSGRARVTQIFYDDKACVHDISIASTLNEDKDLEDRLTNVLHSIYNCGNYMVNIEIVPQGSESSDHYNHMAYLSMKTGVIKAT